MNLCTNPEYWADTLGTAKFILMCLSIGMFLVYMLLYDCAKRPVPIYVWVILGVVHLLVTLGFIFTPFGSTVVTMCH
jgi:hypothetical protein|nr:MAG TPA: hypothetical protein [Caudoviricetes sp.]